ncbi:sialate O-acetylesterase [uncultured Bacteroides sp.]|uniref:sialate O-acetylesterase n=1 Tax=uncultured Bacteroides sp. TaxID=162156 RepID=UPI0025ECDF6F|nr:sialate O-acetylesterase [uncultured Bacteroides sp.]
MKKNIYIIWLLLLYAISIQAEVKLPGIFSDRMILQRDVPIPVWGWAEPKETVVIDFDGKQYKTRASQTGEWSVNLPKHKAGGPYELKINRTTLQDVYVGDVYLCSGQSNMELTVKRVMDKYRDEIMSYENNLIRYTKTKYAYNFIEPQQDSENEWKICTQENALNFAALCYFFAKEMQAEKGVAIGIINSSWGGTNIAAWSTRQSLEKYAKFKKKLQSAQYFNPNYPDSVKQAEKELTNQWHRQQSANDLGNKEKWTQDGFNDSDWKEVDVFNSNWGGNWNAPANGVHYFRQRINIPASLAGQKATLRVGTLKDADATYINGVCVGKTSYQYPPRIYQVPEGTLRAGENEITIRLVSNAGRPAFVKGKPYQLEVGGQTIPLAATWKHKIGCTMGRIPSTTGFQNEPTGLYNSMIHPLRNYAIRGAIWYQGESDTGPEGSKLYEGHLIDLVNDWRAQWNNKNLPFVIVQLANYQQRSNKPVESGNARVREGQRRATLQLKNAGLATAIDLGESNDIHPLNKKDLAHRCVLQMKKLSFGEKNIVAEGPMAETAELKEDGRIVISFSKGTGTLKQAEALEGIAVAGKDGKYKFVKAYTEGDKVIAQWEGKGIPASIRYAWENNPPSSIYNTEGLPASSFQLPVLSTK